MRLDRSTFPGAHHNLPDEMNILDGFVVFYICNKHFYICHRGPRVMLAHFLTNPANERSLLRQLVHSNGFIWTLARRIDPAGTTDSRR